MSRELAGVIGAPVTPFSDGNKVDYDTFAKQVNFLVESGVAALAHPMHIGESINMTDQERRDLAKVLVEAADGRVPTYVHVSFAGTDLSVDLARHCAKVGSTGVVLLAPYYWQPTPRNIIEHFVAVTSAHGGELIAYNNPKATNVSLTMDICTELLERIPGFVGLKDASFHMETFTDYCRLADAAPHPLSVYTGIEYLLTSVPVGGRGCFSACSEVAPNLVQSLYDACTAGRIAEARELQFKVRLLLSRLMRIYPSTIKYAMELMGRPVGQVRHPIARITEAEMKETRDELAALGVLDSEPHGWSAAPQSRPVRAAASA